MEIIIKINDYKILNYLIKQILFSNIKETE